MGTDSGAPTGDFEDDPRPLDGDLDGTDTTDMGYDEFKWYQTQLPFILLDSGE